MNAITLERDAALSAQTAIAKIRAMCPILNEVSDNEILKILVSRALAKEAET